ncbi:MAG: diaminopimelate decarboxylase [Muribaculaceae bacterium]|nr:diaminopimelate decarboxylase [Muribaculaceae bacterium]
MTLDLSKLQGLKTPVYVYDRALLEATLQEIKSCIEGKPVMVHYAVKANCNPEIMKMIAGAGFGADCVSGGEIKAAVAAGFAPESICYAGVGKTDDEILTGVKAGIGFFNVESIEELEILNAVAKEEGAVINVALRVNPNIDAHTHHYITTGLEENKFGIDLRLLDKAIKTVASMSNLELCGLHFHIGSQITVMDPFVLLCEKINGLIEHYRKQGVEFKVIDVGGGLGIDYDNPDANPIPPFKAYFDTLLSHLHLGEGQTLHCELGRSIVGQCGSLLSKVTFVKEGIGKKFVILDAGMNDLMRPALYGAHHNIENLSAAARQGDEVEVYDVVGPICESSDIFGKEERLPATRRGDLIALRSAGAYGESMASTYNMRPLPASILL